MSTNLIVRSAAVRFGHLLTRSILVGTLVAVCTLSSAQAKQMELCDLEQGPNGVQCVEKNTKPPVFELCDLEQGPNGLQCVENTLEPQDPGPDQDAEPPVDPQPIPDPEQEPQADPKPQAEPTGDAAPSGSKPAVLIVEQRPAEQVQTVPVDPSTQIVASEDNSSDSLPDWMPMAAALGLGLIAAPMVHRRRKTNQSS